MTLMAKKRELSTYTPEQILAIRTRLDLTQAEAADKVGVARRTWQDWERGVAMMPVPVARLLDCLQKLKKS